MAPASNDWILWLAGSLLLAAGSLLALWALFGDRSRGRRRCPQCWYSLDGIPGLLCPECGRAVPDERALRRTRRRWRLCALACFLAMGGAAGFWFPMYQRGGWVGLVPSSALVYIAPADRGAGAASPSALLAPGTATLPVLGGIPVLGGLSASPTAWDLLEDAAWTRLRTGRLWAWQSQVYLDRWIDNLPPYTVEQSVDAPARWPTARPVPVLVKPLPLTGVETLFRRRGDTGPWAKADNNRYATPVPALFTPDPASPPLVARIEMRLNDRVVHRRDVALPTLIAGDETTFLDQLADDATNALVLAALNPRLSHDSPPRLLYNDRADTDAWNRIDFGVAFTAEVIVGKRIIARGRGVTEWSGPVWKDWEELTLDWADDPALARAPGAVLRLSADPAAAAQGYLQWPFDKPRPACWAGALTISLSPAAP